jgi:hypothetical protein
LQKNLVSKRRQFAVEFSPPLILCACLQIFQHAQLAAGLDESGCFDVRGLAGREQLRFEIADLAL